LAHERAVAISIPDSSLEIPERIVVQNTLLAVVGLDDLAVGHYRAHLHIPDSIASVSHRSFCYSFVQSLMFGVAGVLRTLDGFYDCSVRSLVIPASIEIVNEGAFENCRLLLAIDFSGRRCLRVIHGFIGCTSVKQIEIPACVREIGCRAFNNCIELGHFTFAEGSEVRKVGGFVGTRLQSITFPGSIVELASGARDGSWELSQNVFGDGSLILRINGMKRTNLRSVRFPDSVCERSEFVE
jgi:hypothetical protein